MTMLRTLGLALLVAVLTGCASPARIEMMTVDAPLAERVAASKSELKEKIALKDVTGGLDTNPMWKSNVGSREFERALEQSLRDFGLLSPNRQASPYQLTAHLQKVDQPLMGISMTVTATVQYSLVERSSGREVFSQSVVTPYTAAFNAAFSGTERLKIANEGSIRENIRRLISQLLAFKPDTAPAAARTPPAP